MHCVKDHTEVRARHKGFQGREVEAGLKDGQVVIYWIDHLDDHVAHRARADSAEVHLLGILKVKHACDLGGEVIHTLGQQLFRGGAVTSVVLDPEVAVGSARVMRGGEDDRAERRTRLALTDNGRDCWGGDETLFTNPHTADSVSSRHADNGLKRLFVVVTAITAHDQRTAQYVIFREGVEDRLYKVLEVHRVTLHHRHLLAEARGAHLHALDRRRRDAHRRHPETSGR
mmetsp:Transcript_15760/g.36712  ORF Transcript_15760/g.36712 Transcript_15760/m.36712 type:complete len:229 (+) Transcript_15760:1067-1753(+)